MSDYGELPKVCTSSTPRAKRNHRCCECRGTIQAGETYHCFTGLWDGEWSTYRTCSECEVLRGDLCKAMDQDDWPPFGNLYEEVFESRYNGPEFVVRFMTTRRKRGAEPSPKNWMENIEAELCKKC